MDSALWGLVGFVAILAVSTGWLIGTVHGLRKQVAALDRVVGQLMVTADKTWR